MQYMYLPSSYVCTVRYMPAVHQHVGYIYLTLYTEDVTSSINIPYYLPEVTNIRRHMVGTYRYGR